VPESQLKILVVGCGSMGTSHALAYRKINDFKIVGLVSRRPASRNLLSTKLGGVETFDDFIHALDATKPDAVSINTYPDTHARLAMDALDRGAHVFVEKPLGVTVEEAVAVLERAKETDRKVVVGYILRHHPMWTEFIRLARTLGKPLVMRMNLNQQGSGKSWEGQKNLMQSASPIVDCGVHYVDVMCRMARSKPVRVHAIGARLTDEISPEMYNYGQMQVQFQDGSVGWYEAGWGPMMSETAYFIKDVIGPHGSVSIVSPEGKSDDLETHTRSSKILHHRAELDRDSRFVHGDTAVETSEEPDHYKLCEYEQQFFLRTIRENLDLTEHLEDAVTSLRIVLAADVSCRTGKVIDLL